MDKADRYFNYLESEKWKLSGISIESDWKQIQKIWEQISDTSLSLGDEISAFFIEYRDHDQIDVYRKELYEKRGENIFNLSPNFICELVAGYNDIWNKMHESILYPLYLYPEMKELDSEAKYYTTLTEECIGVKYVMYWEDLKDEIEYCAKLMSCLSWCGRNVVIDT